MTLEKEKVYKCDTHRESGERKNAKCKIPLEKEVV
jgi:hypothetical protein